MSVMPKAASARRQVVLIVDDEADILASLSSILESALPTVTCKTAASGAEGIKALQQGAVDLILSDYKMPGMDGLAFLARARELAPRVPRILLTAFPDLDLAMSAINDTGIEMFFTKPIDADRIVRAVRSSLATRQAREDRDKALGRAVAMRKAAED